MASNLQETLHLAHPMHLDESIIIPCAVRLIAPQGQALTQAPHFTHLSSFIAAIAILVLCFSSRLSLLIAPQGQT